MTDDVLKLARGFTLPLWIVTEASAIVATRGAGKSSASAVIAEEVFNLGVQVVIFDRTGVYWGLRSNVAGDGPGLGIYVLGGPHGDVPLEPHAGKLIADLVVDSGHSFVLDLSDMSKGGAVKFAADFLERLYDRKARARSTTLVVMDEAHFYAPQTPRGGFKGDAARLMGAMEDVVGLGRSRGLGVVLTTQRTQALNKAVLDLIETLFVMRMLSPRARDAVQEWIREKHEDDREGVIETLESLPTGTAWVWSPLRGVLQKVALRRIKTFDSYATPEPGQERVEPTVRKELDLTALGEQMRSTAERAKENDPIELRKRVRELERRLAETEASFAEVERVATEKREPMIERVEVEVPVLTAAELLEVTTAVNIASAALREAAEAEERLTRALAPVGTAISRLVETHPAPTKVFRPQPVERSGRGSRVREPAAVPPAAAKPPTASAAGQPQPSLNGSVAGSEQKILDALAWYEVVGVPRPTRSQVGFVAGYKARGGRFSNLLGTLRGRGLIEYPESGFVVLTDEGRALASHPDLPRSNEALHEMVLGQLQPSQAKLLEHVLAVGPDGTISRAALAEATGYEARGGRFVNLLGSLRTLGLIDYPTPGEVAPRDVLFPA